MYTYKNGNFGNNPFLFIFMLLKRVCTYVILGILVKSHCVYVFFVFMVCTQVILGIFESRLFVYAYVVVDVMYKCKSGNFGNETLCLCLYCCRGYVHLYG